MQLQVLEVAIGLVAAFFVLSLIASAVVELGSAWFGKRSKDLNAVLDEMLSTGSANAIDFRNTSVYRVMQTASRRKRGWRKNSDDREPSYMAARSFADAVVEGLVKLKSSGEQMGAVIDRLADGPLKDRIQTLRAEVGDDLTAIKAGLEGWFDGTMERLEGAYKRWSQWILLGIGIALAVGLNVSAIRIVDSLWNDATVRTAVVEQAEKLQEGACPNEAATCEPEEKIEAAISDLDSLQLPIGWSDGWEQDSGWFWTFLGFLPTGAAVVLGAPFWFDLLSRLAGARGSRGKPPKAPEDDGSATTEVLVGGAVRSHPSFAAL